MAKKETASNSPTTSAVIGEWWQQRLGLVRSVVAPKCTKNEFELLCHIAKKYELDPLAGEIRSMKLRRKNKETGVWEDQPAVIDISRYGYLNIAHRSKVLNGFVSGIRDNKIGIAFAKVYRKDMQYPFYFEAYFDDFADRSNPKWWNQDKGCRGSAWRIMLVNCAEHQCLRRAFSIPGACSAEELGAITEGVTEYLQDSDIPEIEMRDTALLESQGGRPADAGAAPSCYCGHEKHEGPCTEETAGGRKCPCRQYTSVDTWNHHVTMHEDPAKHSNCPMCHEKLPDGHPAKATMTPAPGAPSAAPAAKAVPPPVKPAAPPSKPVTAPPARPAQAKGDQPEVIKVPLDADAYIGRDWKINMDYIGDLIGILNSIIKVDGRHICNERLAQYGVRIASINDITEEHAIELFAKHKMKYKPKVATPASKPPAAKPPAPAPVQPVIDIKVLMERLKDHGLKLNPDAGPGELEVHQLKLVQRATALDLDSLADVEKLRLCDLVKVDELLTEDAKKSK